MRKIVTYGIIFFQILLIISLVKSIQLTLKARTRVTDLEVKKEKVMQEQKRLGEELTYVESDYYVEKVAREELQLSKIGEKTVMVPDELTKGASRQEVDEIDNKPNYLKWWDVVKGRE